MKTEIMDELSSYISSNILKQPTRKILPDEKIISNGLIDSFHLVDVSLFIEERFGVLIDDTELNASTFDSLNELADLISQRQ
jgi:acyl carrier protein